MAEIQFGTNGDYDFHKMMAATPICEKCRQAHFSLSPCLEIGAAALQNGDCFTSQGEIVRPYIDLSPIPRWRKILNRIAWWIRSL